MRTEDAPNERWVDSQDVGIGIDSLKAVYQKSPLGFEIRAGDGEGKLARFSSTHYEEIFEIPVSNELILIYDSWAKNGKTESTLDSQESKLTQPYTKCIILLIVCAFVPRQGRD